MFSPGLHALARYYPDTPVEINLIPPCANHLSRPCRRQDQEMQGVSTNAATQPQRVHEIGDLLIREGSEVLDFLELARHRQQRFQMAAPRCGVLTGAQASGLGGVQYLLDTAARAPSRLRRRVPNAFEGLQDERRGDVAHRHIAKHRVCDRSERRMPLAKMLGASPRALVGPDVVLGELLERNKSCCVCHCSRTSGSLVRERIGALCDQTPVFQGQFAGALQRHDGCATKAETASLAAERIAENPRPTALDLQPQPAAVPVHALGGTSDIQRCEFSHSCPRLLVDCWGRQVRTELSSATHGITYIRVAV